jgi:hypothetical protein
MPNIDQLIQGPPNPNTLPNAPVGIGMMQETSSTPAQTPPTIDSASQMATPDQKAELQKMFNKVQDANSQLATKSVIDRNQMSVMRKELMMKMFDLLKQAGVDPSDPMSIRSFLEKLGERDPQLLEMFEVAFQGLVNPSTGSTENSTEETSPETEDNEEGAPNLMDRFQNLTRMGGNGSEVPPTQ